MSFESELYQSMCVIYPEMTVRSFSVMLGKSEGYWSSITTQGLRVSTDALVNLFDGISAKKILIEQGSAKNNRLTAVQEKIRIELVDRFMNKTGFDTTPEPTRESDVFYGAMPFGYSVF